MKTVSVVVVVAFFAATSAAQSTVDDATVDFRHCLVDGSSCVSKCCQEHQILQVSPEFQCVDVPTVPTTQQPAWTDAFHAAYNNSRPVTYGFPPCGNDSWLYQLRQLTDSSPTYVSGDTLVVNHFTFDRFCGDYIDNRIGFVVCIENVDKSPSPPPVIPKCCPIGQGYDDQESTCRTMGDGDDDVQWFPDLVVSNGSQPRRLVVKENYDVRGIPKCGRDERILRTKTDDKVPFDSRQWLLADNGRLAVVGGGGGNGKPLFASPGNYCVDVVNTTPRKGQNAGASSLQVKYPTTFHIAQMCISDPFAKCEKELCIRKCCPMGNDMVHGHPQCVPTTNGWKPTYYEEGWWQPRPARTVPDNGHVFFGLPDCGYGLFLIDPEEMPDDVFYLLTDGKLYVPRFWEKFMVDVYCIDHLRGPDNRTKEVVALCFPEDAAKTTDSPEMKAAYAFVYPIGLIISDIFLLATFIVYAILPELQNLHGKTLLSHVASLFFSYLFLTIAQIGGATLAMNEPGFCKFVAVMTQFSFLSAFFWLNAMCFDIWWTFSGLRPLRGGAGERDRKKFIIYSAYSWLCPLFISAITCIIEFAPGISPLLLKPLFGYKRCWFIGEWEVFAYFYGPIAFLLTVNVILFLLTARKLLQVYRDTKMLNKDKSETMQNIKLKQEKEKQRMMLYLKLFIVMGITWVAEVVSWGVGKSMFYWYVTDIVNTLQGVLIFIIFVCKRKIFSLLKGRLSKRASSWRTRYSATSSCRVNDPRRGSPTQTSSVKSRDTSLRQHSVKLSNLQLVSDVVRTDTDIITS